MIHPDDLAHVRRLLEHGEWSVRVAAARTLARLGEKSDFARLCARLADASWWVRHRAAQALCNLPGVARSELEALARSSTDRFAADALHQALAERPA